MITYVDLIRLAALTYFHLFRRTLFHDKAPWTGHLAEGVRQIGAGLTHIRGWKSSLSERHLH